MRAGARLGAALASFALVGSACTVGGGSGTAQGDLRVVGCDSEDSWEMARPYNLAPSFFAGTPVDDICPLPGPCEGPHINRLSIRMQHIANRPVEANDVLYVTIENALKVAQCLRGAVMNGEPTWDLRPITAPDGALIANVPWCDWTAHLDADGGVADPADGGLPGMTALRARINISTQDYVRASLTPKSTCPEAFVTGVALPGSWIDFLNFGSALMPDTPPDQRKGVDNDFKVDFGERLRAYFHLELGDQRVIAAMKAHDAIPAPNITGTLDGWFDFDLERGRAAQPFP